jgi:hypothetical protein
VLLTATTSDVAVSNRAWVDFDGLRRRDTGERVAVTGNVSLVPDDDRYIEYDSAHVAVGDAQGSLVEKCRNTGGFANMEGFAGHYVCFDEIANVDDTVVMRTQRGAALLVTRTRGRSFLVHERVGSDVFPSRFHVRFDNGGVVSRSSRSTDLAFFGPDVAVVLDIDGEGTPRHTALTSDGEALTFRMPFGATIVASGGALLATGSTTMAVLDYRETGLSADIDLTSAPRGVAFHTGRVLLLDDTGVLSIRTLGGGEPEVISEGPFDTMALHDRLIVTTVATGDRAGVYLFDLPERFADR